MCGQQIGRDVRHLAVLEAELNGNAPLFYAAGVEAAADHLVLGVEQLGLCVELIIADADAEYGIILL